MSREIKFRMWHKKSKKMFDVESINFKDRVLNMWNSIVYTLSIFSLDDVILMQYTGFHDRFGNEIYESDIVYVLSEDENAIIEWDEQTARFIIHFDGWIADFNNYYGKELEIMGNIYNNPELLGGE